MLLSAWKLRSLSWESPVDSVKFDFITRLDTFNIKFFMITIKLLGLDLKGRFIRFNFKLRKTLKPIFSFPHSKLFSEIMCNLMIVGLSSQKNFKIFLNLPPSFTNTMNQFVMLVEITCWNFFLTKNTL